MQLKNQSFSVYNVFIIILCITSQQIRAAAAPAAGAGQEQEQQRPPTEEEKRAAAAAREIAARAESERGASQEEDKKGAQAPAPVSAPAAPRPSTPELMAQVQNYGYYDFANLTGKPLYVAFYINGRRVPYFEMVDKQEQKVDSTIRLETQDKLHSRKIGIPYISGGILANTYPIMVYSYNEKMLTPAIESSALQQTPDFGFFDVGSLWSWGAGFEFVIDDAGKLSINMGGQSLAVITGLSQSYQYSLTNNTALPVFVGVYYHEHDTRRAISTMSRDPEYAVQRILPRQTISIKIPNLASLLYLYFVNDPLKLTDTMDPQDTRIASYPLGKLILGYSLTIDKSSAGQLGAYTSWSMAPGAVAGYATTAVYGVGAAGKGAARVIISGPKAAITTGIKEYLTQTYYHESMEKVAVVTPSEDISDAEQEFLTKRAVVVNHWGRVKFKQNADQKLLQIGLCSSGGGYRAMLSTLGFLRGLEKTNFLDTCSYCAGLSGSTWAISGWIQSGSSVEEYIDKLFKSPNFLARPLQQLNDREWRAIGFEIAKKYLLYNAPPSVIDAYGTIIANRVLAGIDDPSLVFLMGRTDEIKKGQRPFPIYTAVADITAQEEVKAGAAEAAGELPRAPQTHKQYNWVEFNPFTVNFVDLPKGALGKIDTWAFGRTFDPATRASIDNPPPHSLGFGMGIWGSAGSIDIEQLWNTQIKQQLPGMLSSMIQQVSVDAPAGQSPQISPEKIDNLFINAMQSPLYKQANSTVLRGGRLFPAIVPNWSDSVPGKDLVLVDAGIDFNIPLPPLFKRDRDIDVIIINDASGDLHKGGPIEFEKALKYLHSKGIKYDRAPIDKDFDRKPFVALFPENISKYPLLIYVPLRNQAPGVVEQYTGMAEYSTFNFSYTKAQAEKLIEISENKIRDSEKDIIKVIDYFQEMRANNPQRVEFDKIVEQLRDKVKEVEAIIRDSRESTLVKQFIQHLVDLLKRHNNVVSPTDLGLAQHLIGASVPAQLESANNRVKIRKLRNQIAHILFQIGQQAPGSGAAREVTGMLEMVDSLLLEDRTLSDDDVKKVNNSLIQAQGELDFLKKR